MASHGADILQAKNFKYYHREEYGRDHLWYKKKIITICSYYRNITLKCIDPETTSSLIEPSLCSLTRTIYQICTFAMFEVNILRMI